MPSKTTKLKEMIQSEINREHLLNDTISFNHMVNVWIAKTNDKLNVNDRKKSIKLNDDAIIVVDDDDDDIDISSRKTVNKSNNPMNKAHVNLGISDHLQMETSWINDICRNAQIKLESEEIVPGMLLIAHFIIEVYKNSIFQVLFINRLKLFSSPLCDHF